MRAAPGLVSALAMAISMKLRCSAAGIRVVSAFQYRMSNGKSAVRSHPTDVSRGTSIGHSQLCDSRCCPSFTSTVVVYGVADPDVTALPEYGVVAVKGGGHLAILRNG